MEMPRNYSETKAITEYEALAAGGYVCVIKAVTEGKSSKGNDMLTVFVDIAEGPEALRFTNEYNNDTREDKKWPITGRSYIMVLDRDGNTNRQLKTFIECVTESNPGWSVKWGNDFAKNFINKKIGCIFGKEEYQNNQGDYKWSTKCKSFRSVGVIKSGRFKVPDDKEMDRTGVAATFSRQAPSQAAGDGFMDIPDGIDEELPFN